ncbi:hypothetical protein [Sanguibacter sp. 25GB23B1]|uniref:hypothetical protein n=1 Tax=unclassified Sanguibacter TaxID=2645534 RepID=UPI0032B00502
MSQWDNPARPGSVPTGPPAGGPAPRRSRRPLIITLAVLVVVLVAAGALFVSGVFTGDGDDADASPTTPAATPTIAPTPEEIPGKTIGTQANPYTPGDSFKFLDDWTFSLGTTDFDTWPDVGPALEQKFPDSIDSYRPGPGMVFVSAPMSMTYTGPPTYQGRITTITLHYMTADGTALPAGNCGVVGMSVEAFDVSDAVDLPAVEGAACAEITPEQAVGGQWRISLDFLNEGDGTEYLRQIFYTAA